MKKKHLRILLLRFISTYFNNLAISRVKVLLPLNFSMQFRHWINKAKLVGQGLFQTSSRLSEVSSQQS